MYNIELVALIVRDYDAAVVFFVDILQFELVEDTPSLTNDGHPKRCVVVRPKDGRTGIQSRAPRETAKPPLWAISSPVAQGCSSA
jgi:catechol 2,3-dioxygenase-like lactoylglutathione lyase family enzyme